MGAQAHYAASGVDTTKSKSAVDGLVEVLNSIDPGRSKKAVLKPGHYASVIETGKNEGIAICTDGVGTKVLIAQQMNRFNTIGIDCVAMNVNDIICIGAEPLALVDYVAVEEADAEILRAIGVGLKDGAEQAGIEIPGGELAQTPEIVRGSPSPRGFDLVGTCIGQVKLDRMITGSSVKPGDAIIGIPSSGIHANGMTLARHALLDSGRYSLDRHIDELGRSLGEELLEPTNIYVAEVLELSRSSIDVHGLAHVTGDGVRNLLRLDSPVGYELSEPLPVPPIFRLIQDAASASDAEMAEVFNMGTGFFCIVEESSSDQACRLLARHRAGARRVGTVTAEAGAITLAHGAG